MWYARRRSVDQSASAEAGFAKTAPCPTLIGIPAQKVSSSGLAILINTAQFEYKCAAIVVDCDIEGVSARADIGPGEFPPLDRRHAVVESLDLALGEQIGEFISPNWLAFRRVKSHDFPVAHVVPIIQRYEGATVRHKKFNRRHRIEQRSG